MCPALITRLNPCLIYHFLVQQLYGPPLPTTAVLLFHLLLLSMPTQSPFLHFPYLLIYYLHDIILLPQYPWTAPPSPHTYSS